MVPRGAAAAGAGGRCPTGRRAAAAVGRQQRLHFQRLGPHPDRPVRPQQPQQRQPRGDRNRPRHVLPRHQPPARWPAAGDGRLRQWRELDVRPAGQQLEQGAEHAGAARLPGQHALGRRHGAGAGRLLERRLRRQGRRNLHARQRLAPAHRPDDHALPVGWHIQQLAKRFALQPHSFRQWPGAVCRAGAGDALDRHPRQRQPDERRPPRRRHRCLFDEHGDVRHRPHPQGGRRNLERQAGQCPRL